MDSSNVSDVTVAAAAVVVILKVVFDFIGKGTMPRWASGMREDVRIIRDDAHVLKQWHAPDATGEMTWKNSRMIDCVETLTQVVDRQTRVMERLMPVLERLEAKL